MGYHVYTNDNDLDMTTRGRWERFKVFFIIYGGIITCMAILFFFGIVPWLMGSFVLLRKILF